MTNSVADLTSPDRKSVFEDYLIHYDQLQHSSVKVCKNREVIEKARRILLEEDPAERFKTFDFYQTVHESLNLNQKNCRKVLNVFIKAVEVLETICVNLFLFPWKKEIKVIKTFTGPFVYCVQPILSKNVVQGILESIGYYNQSDTEYHLTTDPDLVWAKRVGFELFLARVECEYLLEVTGQEGHDECLEALLRRAVPTALRDSCVTGHGELRGNKSSLEDRDVVEIDAEEINERPEPVVERLLLNEPVEMMGASTQTGDSEIAVKKASEQDRHHPHELEVEAVAGSSILEMQQNYPDLAIRQRPIFRKDRGGSYPFSCAKACERLEDDGDFRARTRGLQAQIHDLSGPQSSPAHEPEVPASSISPVFSLPKICDTGSTLEMQTGLTSSVVASLAPQCDLARQHAKCPLAQKKPIPATALPMELRSRWHKQCLSEMCIDEPLKYPIEETAQIHPSGHHHVRPTITAGGPVEPLSCSPLEASHQPIMCSPSPLTICSISGCSTCSGSNELREVAGNTIKEPPSSLYIPPGPLDMCSLPLEPGLRHTGGSAAVPLAPSGMETRSSTQQSEDDILQTYVLVEHEKK